MQNAIELKELKEQAMRVYTNGHKIEYVDTGVNRKGKTAYLSDCPHLIIPTEVTYPIPWYVGSVASRVLAELPMTSR